MVIQPAPGKHIYVVVGVPELDQFSWLILVAESVHVWFTRDFISSFITSRFSLF